MALFEIYTTSSRPEYLCSRSLSVTPYSGSIHSPGTTKVSIICGGATINTGDVIVGDADGLVVAPIATLEQLLCVAEHIARSEAKLMHGMLDGKSLTSMTNFEDHLLARQKGQVSSFGFRLD